ncbi:uncharacterized protein DUF3726 [Aminobacter aminovorans]|uniref:Protein of uncharacterized function (DUF3726) n=1 Tax=Aminobacter aminovorans TaxID=83263 RepID=A0A381IP11_AMIAI|nr:DUF3726 domain-containing protein [Aminobacter aminovorans]TCS21326.1 uncharacterized protein DUF3726 [Aminobacter aminovorans]SUY29114.1 Protein of uncharacterised function (DUF3726) [Aminobacter aminovorans]
MTTIQLSYNEAQTLARKAANGAGLPHGVAEDIGGAAVWLSARGVDAIGVVVAALSDCQPAILAGQAAIDALCCGESDEVNVDDDNPRLLLIGLAGAAAMNMGLSLAVRFRNGDVVSLAQVSDLADQASSIEALRLTSRNTDDMSERLVSRRPAATDTKAYAAALGLAAKTYVPASELSRVQGAGAGTTDND